MKELIEKINIWWLPLAVREKQAVLIGGGCLAIFILYAGIWSPLLTHIDAMRKQIVAGEKTLQFMREAEKQIAQHQGGSHHSPAILSPVDFLNDLQKQLDKTGMAPAVKQLKQSSDNAVTIQFQQIEFDRLASLLLSIMQEQRVSVEQMTSVAATTPGMVNADLVLKLG